MAWVTGAASGIGLATARALGELGARVLSIDIDPRVVGVAAEWGGAGASVIDVADDGAVGALAEQAASDGNAPEIVVNAAGVGPRELLRGHTSTTWRRVLSVNLDGPFHVIRHAFPHMCVAGWGRIINVASSSAVRVGVGSGAYGASKAGLVALTKAAAIEGAPLGITANAVAPGIVDTPMIRAFAPTDEEVQTFATTSAVANPRGRALEPVDIARVIAFLALPGSSGINGQTIHVNHGSLMP